MSLKKTCATFSNRLNFYDGTPKTPTSGIRDMFQMPRRKIGRTLVALERLQ